MATLVPYTNCQLATRLDGTDCLGDSRLIINTNFENIEVATCTLSSNISAQNITNSNSFQTLSAETSVLSTQIQFLSSTLTALNSSFNVGNVGPLSTLGTLVSSLSVFNTSGAYIGYMPIYR
jgi:hypothetical protein